MSVDLYESLPDALKVVPFTATQAPADDLISYAELTTRLAVLSDQDRIHVETIGHSRAGRTISLIAITEDASESRLAGVREVAAALTSPTIRHHTVLDPKVLVPQLETIPSGARIPILIQSSNFGSEAAQLEALLTLAESLAVDESDEVRDALSRVVLLIVPLINPDGYETARAQWAARPGSSAHPALGNEFDIEVTREYLHLVEPESRALATVVARWHPFVVWEVHEDGLGLSWAHPETCLCPPMTMYAVPGIDVAIAPSVDDARIYAEHQRYGSAIAKAWAEKGYRYLHDNDGAHGWPRFSIPGADGSVPAPEARFTQTMPLRGVTAFITESARAPGSQTWTDRVGQKVSAGLAVLHTAATAGESAVQIVADVQRAGANSAPDFFLLPADQDPYILGRALEILIEQGVSVYLGKPADEGSAVVVPAAQPLRATIELLLTLGLGRHLSLVAALNLRVRPSGALSDSERDAWAGTPLSPLTDAASITTTTPLTGIVRFENSHHGVRLVSRLLATPGAAVGWVAAGGAGDGFIAQIPGHPATAAELLRGLRVRLTPGLAEDLAAAKPLAPRRIGVWAGQGVAENTYNGTLARWFLTEWDLPVEVIGAGDLGAATLAGLDVLIVPAGDAAAMADGDESEAAWERYPWDPDFDTVALSTEQSAALRDWVEAGGTYIGVTGGGGRLSAPGALDIADLAVDVIPGGVGLVDLGLDQPDDLLFDGIRGSWDEAGEWRPGLLGAMFVAQPTKAHPGGSGFVAGERAGERSGGQRGGGGADPLAQLATGDVGHR